MRSGVPHEQDGSAGGPERDEELVDLRSHSRGLGVSRERQSGFTSAEERMIAYATISWIEEVQ
jgi:hypothetical protein